MIMQGAHLLSLWFSLERDYSAQERSVIFFPVVLSLIIAVSSLGSLPVVMFNLSLLLVTVMICVGSLSEAPKTASEDVNWVLSTSGFEAKN